MGGTMDRSKEQETVEEIYDSRSFTAGFKAGISIAIGYFPIALTFGLLSKTTGLSFSETVFMSLFVFAGASQYIALSLLTLGTSMVEIVLTTFIVNIRHFLMATALNEKVEDDSSWKKALYAFGITDETFSVLALTKHSVTTGYVVGVMTIAYGSWVISSGIGYVLSSSLPKVLQEGMSVALYAMFIGLLTPSLKKSWKVVFLAVLGASLNTIFTLTELLSTGWAIVSATLISAILVEGIEWMKQKGGNGYV
jgi:4-azaleucine resistance transporter AzlC